MKKLKIAMFGHKRIPSREGGVEIVVEQLSTKMVKCGMQVTCFNRGGQFMYSEKKEQLKSYQGIIIKKVPTIDIRGVAAVSASFFAALCSAVGPYDVIHIHAEGPAFFCWIPKLFHKKVVVTIHGLDWMREKWQGGLGSKFIKKGEEHAVKYADDVIVLSKNMQQYFYDKYHRKTHFIPNGVERPEIKAANQINKMYGLEKNQYILFLGRLVPEKGLMYLINSFKNVNEYLHYRWFSHAWIFLEQGVIGLVLTTAFFLSIDISILKKRKKSEKLYDLAVFSFVPTCIIGLIYNSALELETAYLIALVCAFPFILEKRNMTVIAKRG